MFNHKEVKRSLLLKKRFSTAVKSLAKLTTFTAFFSSWLYDHDGQAVARVNARLGAVTQLDVSTAEGLQVRSIHITSAYNAWV
jgi:hypothetical protein